MGRVFTVAELEAGRVPLHSSFADVAVRIREAAASPRRLFPVGGVIFGSYTKADRIDFNPRSDLDVLVVYDKRYAADARTAFADWHDFAAERYVKLNLIPIDSVTAKNGGHFISATFMNELRRAEEHGSVIGPRGVSTLIAAPTVDPKLDLHTYVARKLGQFEKAIAGQAHLTEAERYKLMERTLNSPIHAARKVLEARGIPCTELGKHALIGLMREQESKVLADFLRHVAEVDGAVTTLTQEIVAHRSPIARYGPMLNTITGLLPVVRHYFWRLANES